MDALVLLFHMKNVTKSMKTLSVETKEKGLEMEQDDQVPQPAQLSGAWQGAAYNEENPFCIAPICTPRA
jgi:hypothetical protein